MSIFGALLLLVWGGTCGVLFWQLQRELDRFDVEEIETIEGLLAFGSDGRLRLRDDYHNHPSSKNVIDRFVEILSPDGTVLFRNDQLGDRELGGVPFKGEGVGGYFPRSVRLVDGTRVRLVSRMHLLDRRALVIRLGHSEERLFSSVSDLLMASLLVLPVALAVAGGAGYGLARRALSPIGQMVRRAREITPEMLHERLPHDDTGDELGELASVFNDTLSRLEKAFEQLRRFTSDAAHELRTPLAMIRSVGEVGLQKDGNRAAYRDIVGSMLEEVNRLTCLIDSLLTISRADSGRIHLHRAAVCVMGLARDAAALIEILMEEKSQRLVLEGNDELQVQGDYLFLRQSLVNILHNAIKYSPVGGTIMVRVRSDGAGHISIEVQDNGPGIPCEHHDKVFDRFYRVDKARWRESGGAGLGLSIAKWAVEAHGGSIALDTPALEGCTFRITLPADNPR